MEEIEVTNLFNLKETIAKEIFKDCNYAWEVLPKINDFIITLGNSLNKEKFRKIGENIWIAKSAQIAPSSYIVGPCIIDEEAQVKHCAYIRENVIIGKGAMVRKFDRT